MFPKNAVGERTKFGLLNFKQHGRSIIALVKSEIDGDGVVLETAREGWI